MIRFRATTLRLGLPALLGALLIASAFPAYAAAATRPTTFWMYMGSHCINGFASDSATLDVVWKDADGTRKAHRTKVASAAGGEFTVCSKSELVEMGDLVRATDGTSVHELVVPELTAYGNRVKDVYKGRGPAGEYIKLVCLFSNGFEPCIETWKIHVSSEGKWSFSPGWNVGAGETMGVQWKSPSGDLVRTYGTPAILTVRIGSSRVEGTTRNGVPATVVLKRGPAMDVKAMANTASSPLSGDFTGQLRDQLGNKVNVRPGDLISSDIAADLEWVVPDIQATGDSSTDHVVGRCLYDDPLGPLSGDLRIYAYHNGEVVSGSEITDYMADDGSFDVAMEFQAGDRLVVRCGMSTGDWAEKWFVAE